MTWFEENKKEKEKLHKMNLVENIVAKYIGGFISSGAAMSEIVNISDSKILTPKMIRLIDLKTSESICELKDSVILMNKK